MTTKPTADAPFKINLNGSAKSARAKEMAARYGASQKRFAPKPVPPGARLAIIDPIVEIPEDIPMNYGMIPPKIYDAQTIAVTRTRDLILTGKRQTGFTGHVHDLNHIGKIFNRAQSACMADWFLQSHRLGHPSHVLTRRIMAGLVELQGHLERLDMGGARKTLEFLREEAVVEMLDNCIAADNGEDVPEERGWAYLAYRGDGAFPLLPGVDAGSMDDILDKLADDMGHGGQGIFAAWLVHDPEHAGDTLHRMATRHSGGDGFFRLGLRAMADAIEAELIATDNLILSPWHVDDDHAYERLGLAATNASKVSSDEPLAQRM